MQEEQALELESLAIYMEEMGLIDEAKSRSGRHDDSEEPKRLIDGEEDEETAEERATCDRQRKTIQRRIRYLEGEYRMVLTALSIAEIGKQVDRT